MKRIKIFTTVLLICLFVFSSMYTAFAAVYIEDWGFRFEKINNGSAYEINKYIDENPVVNVPNQYNGFRITSIGEFAFIDTSVISVSLGRNITEIKSSAFINVTSLTKLTIPDSVTEIADTAFLNCENLVIYCNTDSYAHQYAEEKDIDFVLLDTPVEVSVILGDADGDGDVTIVDATVIQRVLVELKDDPDEMIALRASSDGEELNVLHATKIQRWLAQFVVSEPIGSKVTRVLGTYQEVYGV